MLYQNAQQYLEEVRREEEVLVDVVQSFNIGVVYDALLQQASSNIYEGRKVLADSRVNMDFVHIKFELLTELCDDFKNYLNGFSDNVIDILSNFKFNNEVKTMADNRLLYVVIEEFNSKKAYMGLDEVRTEDMGYIFEELVRKFSESYDEEAGAHFTARDIIYLMTDLLVAEEQDILINDNKVKTIYDMAMGTSQMLACMTDRLKQLNIH